MARFRTVSTHLGNLAFAIVGYDGKGFYIQNSWGKSWGDGGVALWLYRGLARERA